jgi:ribonuclease Z
MPEIVLLGTGAAVTDPHRTTTMLAVIGSDGYLALDCGGDLIHRLLSAGLQPLDLRALILTHEHADHTSGFPLFMEKIWLHGRRSPIPVFGPEAALAQARKCFETYDTSTWDGLPEIDWVPIPVEHHTHVFSDWGFDVYASPGDHGVPVMGFSFHCLETNHRAVYSSDTAPSPNIESLATGADLLVHEATGAMKGHTSASQAAALAARSNVKQLVLVHLPPETMVDIDPAREIFTATNPGKELGRYLF